MLHNGLRGGEVAFFGSLFAARTDNLRYPVVQPSLPAALRFLRARRGGARTGSAEDRGYLP